MLICKAEGGNVFSVCQMNLITGSFFFSRSIFFFLKIIYLFIIYLFIYLFWLHWVFVAVHGLSLVVASGGCSSLQCVGFSGLLIAVASLVAEHGL